MTFSGRSLGSGAWFSLSCLYVHVYRVAELAVFVGGWGEPWAWCTVSFAGVVVPVVDADPARYWAVGAGANGVHVDVAPVERWLGRRAAKWRAI